MLYSRQHVACRRAFRRDTLAVQQISTLIIRDIEGLTVALVEVKGGSHSSVDRAEGIRRNVLAHYSGAATPYFVYLSQTTGYIWKREPTREPDDKRVRPPDGEFSLVEVVCEYLPATTSSTTYSGSQLELIYYQWLSDLADGIPVSNDATRKTLSETGFLAAIQGASILGE